MEDERVTKTERIYEGRVVNLRLDTIQLPDGSTHTREIVEHAPSVVMAPLDDHGNVLLVRQYRLAVGKTLLELPAGGMHGDETPEQAADRELREEVGHAAGQLLRLGGYYAAPGFCEEYLHFFIASQLSPSPLDADDDESIEIVPTPLSAIPQMIAAGEIQDAKSIAGLYWTLWQVGKWPA